MHTVTVSPSHTHEQKHTRACITRTKAHTQASITVTASVTCSRFLFKHLLHYVMADALCHMQVIYSN